MSPPSNVNLKWIPTRAHSDDERRFCALRETVTGRRTRRRDGFHRGAVELERDDATREGPHAEVDGATAVGHGHGGERIHGADGGDDDGDAGRMDA